MKYKDIRFWFVQLIYADHNRSSSVQKAIRKCLITLDEGDVGLNVGAGGTDIHPQIKNLDIFPGEQIDYVGKAESIPEINDFFKIVITQETLEHVEKPFLAVQEIYRVLMPGGLLYCQLPFIIGYHPGPTDFWRFTKEGISSMMVNAGFEIEEYGISVGGGTGFYRILVEFLATLLATILPFMYVVFKGLFAIVFYPIKWLDYIFQFSKEKDRIAGGYYIIARKK